MDLEILVGFNDGEFGVVSVVWNRFYWFEVYSYFYVIWFNYDLLVSIW